MGVNYFDPDFLPTELDIYTHTAYYHRGLTAPNCLPVHIPPNYHEKIREFMEFNFFKMEYAGVQYLGTEPNLQFPEEYDNAKIRILIMRLSDYQTVDGAFGHFLCGYFMRENFKDVFLDFAYLPYTTDMARFYADDIPIIFGMITKRPLRDFDIIIFSHCFPLERIAAPMMLVKSGIPLYRWERWDHSLPYYKDCPIVCMAGMGGTFCENLMGHHPVKGPAENSCVDLALIGEGEMMDLKFINRYHQIVNLDGGTKEEFIDGIDNETHKGVYDPRRILYEYADKENTVKDKEGNIFKKQVWQGGGHIKKISMIDRDNKVKYVMAGKGSEEFEDLGPIQKEYLKWQEENET
jgi:hypothetical protein